MSVPQVNSDGQASLGITPQASVTTEAKSLPLDRANDEPEAPGMATRLQEGVQQDSSHCGLVASCCSGGRHAAPRGSELALHTAMLAVPHRWAGKYATADKGTWHPPFCLLSRTSHIMLCGLRKPRGRPLSASSSSTRCLSVCHAGSCRRFPPPSGRWSQGASILPEPWEAPLPAATGQWASSSAPRGGPHQAQLGWPSEPEPLPITASNFPSDAWSTFQKTAVQRNGLRRMPNIRRCAALSLPHLARGMSPGSRAGRAVWTPELPCGSAQDSVEQPQPLLLQDL